MLPLPNLIRPVVDKAGKMLSPWNSYLQQFTQAPPKFLPITVTGSPFSYQAVEPGYISVTGGTVSATSLTRGTDTVDTTGAKLIPVAINDVVQITYSVLPTIIFIASYGNRTG